MKLNLKASAYCSMVERDGELVLMSERSNKTIMVIGKVGAHSSLLSYVTRHTTANTKYQADIDVYWCGRLLGTTHYIPTPVDAGEYYYIDSIPMYSSLA